MVHWTEDADRIDLMLAQQGVPDDIRMKAVAEIMTILGRADRDRRRAEADAEAAKLLPMGAGIVAERQGCHRATAYRRALRARCRTISAQRDK